MTTQAPCRLCGVATDRRGETVQKMTSGGLPNGAPYEVGLCEGCVSLRPDEPGVAVRAALRVLGRDERDDALAATAFDEAALDVSHMLHDAPRRQGRKPQRKPWGHVEPEAKDAMRAAYVRVLDAKVHASTGPARPVPETAPPPGPRGCLLCGVGASTAWRPVTTGALTPGPGMVDGHLCATCTDAHDSVGAIGPTLIERAAMEHAGLTWSDEFRAPGLKPWIAMNLSAGEPWGWVSLHEPVPALDPVEALQAQLADLRAEVAVLRAEVGK